ncbi:Gfo/Idh/MocA family oxidoreductase [Pedobacter frigoris]|uniref:Gfo/Idh/MocA family oxidoreductase n=1 Tax=Pedobacter frigoris TaxID=2571272 RepID=A0A4U1CJZ6_9SPHI|nr:Gfo/Idh/MocA family oxidoreductase [Pedobacter frigoris]TKC05266.1 gfo/Idh/MocA family oxidoreductase [Pedobacter frigoris]
MKVFENDLWIIGTGLMAKEYAKVLKALDVPFIAIGRGEKNYEEFRSEFGVTVYCGGLSKFLSESPKIPKKVIVTVGIEALADTTLQLLNYGVLDILLEKPGFGYPSEIKSIVNTKAENQTVLLAYNRRFYSSIRTVRKLIKADGGVTSFFFEFTEWSHSIRDLVKHPAEHNNWFFGNSTHVIDTAFYLGGKPKVLSAYHSGSIDWHPSSAIFVGSGISTSEALFSYTANWEAPGRWAIEIMTKKHRFILKPMEKLAVQVIGSVQINPIEIKDEEYDIDFKPGLYLQTRAFLENDYSDFCSISEQFEMMDIYIKMSGYPYE